MLIRSRMNKLWCIRTMEYSLQQQKGGTTATQKRGWVPQTWHWAEEDIHQSECPVIPFIFSTRPSKTHLRWQSRDVATPVWWGHGGREGLPLPWSQSQLPSAFPLRKGIQLGSWAICIFLYYKIWFKKCVLDPTRREVLYGQWDACAWQKVSVRDTGGARRWGREEGRAQPGACRCSEVRKGRGPSRRDREGGQRCWGEPRRPWKPLGAGTAGVTEDEDWGPRLYLAMWRSRDKSISEVKRGQKPDCSQLQRKRRQEGGQDPVDATVCPGSAQCCHLQEAFPYGPLPLKATPLYSHLWLSPLWELGAPWEQGLSLCHPCILAHGRHFRNLSTTLSPSSDHRRKFWDFPKTLFSHVMNHSSPNNCFCIAVRRLLE